MQFWIAPTALRKGGLIEIWDSSGGAAVPAGQGGAYST